MAVPGGKDQARSHLEENSSEKQGFFSKVKDSLNLTKHMGFVSDLDSPASQAALAAARDKEEREGVTEVVPQAPISERLKEGVTSIAATATEITTGTAGGVAPISEASPKEAESFKQSALPGEPSGAKKELSDKPVPKESEHQQERSNLPVPKESEHQQERSNLPVAQDPEQRKHSKPWAHWGGHKETEPKAEKESHGFSQWAIHAAKKMGNVVASRDLTDDPSAEKSNKK